MAVERLKCSLFLAGWRLDLSLRGMQILHKLYTSDFGRRTSDVHAFLPSRLWLARQARGRHSDATLSFLSPSSYFSSSSSSSSSSSFALLYRTSAKARKRRRRKFVGRRSFSRVCGRSKREEEEDEEEGEETSNLSASSFVLPCRQRNDRSISSLAFRYGVGNALAATRKRRES